MSKKTYKVTNTRESYKGTLQGTARQDSVQSVLREYPDSLKVWKTGFHPPRFEINHGPEYNKLQNIKEETGKPGEPIDPSYLAGELGKFGDYRCSVELGETEDPEIQIIRCRGTMRSYEIHLDTNVVEWVQS